MRAAQTIVAILALSVLGSAAAAADPNCGPVPLTGCRQPLAAKKAKLILKQKGGSHDKLAWKWTKGEATAIADFGDPVHSTSYTLCIYDETDGVPALKMGATIPPTVAWTAKPKGWKYLDPALAFGGIKSVLLKSGKAGKAKIVVKGHGDNLAMPPLPLSQDQHVIAQLSNTVGVCWEARFSAPAVKSDASQFKDQGDAPLPTATPTIPQAATQTATGTVTATATVAAPTATATNTATATDTPLGGPPTATSTLTRTPSSTGTSTRTATITATVTRTASVAFTPTATPTPGAAVCGNNFLEAGETCATCPADCTVLSCTAVAPIQTFRINFAAPPGSVVTATSALVGYRSNRVSLPGSGAAP